MPPTCRKLAMTPGMVMDTTPAQSNYTMQLVQTEKIFILNRPCLLVLFKSFSRTYSNNSLPVDIVGSTTANHSNSTSKPLHFNFNFFSNSNSISTVALLHDFEEALQRSASKAAGSAESAPDRPRKQR